MSAGNMHGGVYKGCLASAAQNTPCPAGNSFNFSLFHLNALKKFSTAYLPVLATIMLALAMATGALATTRYQDIEPPRPVNNLVLIDGFLTLGSAYKTNSEFFSWFSLLEKSPAVF